MIKKKKKIRQKKKALPLFKSRQDSIKIIYIFKQKSYIDHRKDKVIAADLLDSTEPVPVQTCKLSCHLAGNEENITIKKKKTLSLGKL